MLLKTLPTLKGRFYLEPDVVSEGLPRPNFNVVHPRFLETGLGVPGKDF
jgi:hypothetical protein